MQVIAYTTLQRCVTGNGSVTFLKGQPCHDVFQHPLQANISIINGTKPILISENALSWSTTPHRPELVTIRKLEEADTYLVAVTYVYRPATSQAIALRMYCETYELMAEMIRNTEKLRRPILQSFYYIHHTVCDDFPGSQDSSPDSCTHHWVTTCIHQHSREPTRYHPVLKPGS